MLQEASLVTMQEGKVLIPTTPMHGTLSLSLICRRR